jgi:hypothetical protein
VKIDRTEALKRAAQVFPDVQGGDRGLPARNTQARIADAIEQAVRETAEEIDGALLAEIKNNGPMLIWTGEGEFPRNDCRFRGLSLGRVRLSRWLNA